jgi:hypothetical protein
MRNVGNNNKVRKPSIKSAKTMAWNAFARYIRARDPHCVSCGAVTSQAGHYRPNSDKPNKQLGGNELWYDPRNVNGQCAACNLFRSGNLVPYALYLEAKHGTGILQELNTLYRTPRKWTIEELLGIADKYRKLLEKIETY